MPEFLNLMLRRSITAATFFIALASAPALVCAQTAPQPNSPQVKKQTPATRTSAKTAKRTKKPKQQEVNIIPPPPPPPTPEQMPSVAPEVVYRGGMLSINAPNSTMNDVLSAVRRVTGATVEKPPVGGNDRVVARLGPGQPKDVLESLFQGSRYDYIILGSMTRPGGVDRIILSARANASPATAVATNTNPGQPPKPNVQQQPGDQEEPDTETEDMTVPERDQAEQPEQPEQQPQPPTQQGMPVQPPQEQPQTPEQQNQSQQPRVKSPDELLRELQQMQKQPPDQNQQQQQEQPPPQ